MYSCNSSETISIHGCSFKLRKFSLFSPCIYALLQMDMVWLRLVGCLRIYASLQNIGLFCRALFIETYIFKHPTHRSHPILLQVDSGTLFVCIYLCTRPPPPPRTHSHLSTPTYPHPPTPPLLHIFTPTPTHTHTYWHPHLPLTRKTCAHAQYTHTAHTHNTHTQYTHTTHTHTHTHTHTQTSILWRLSLSEISENKRRTPADTHRCRLFLMTSSFFWKIVRLFCRILSLL